MSEHDTVRTSEKDEFRKRGKNLTVADLSGPDGDQFSVSALNMPELTTAEVILGLQQAYGNRYVQKLVESQRKDGLDPKVVDRIESQRSSGKRIDAAIQSDMEVRFGHDFSEVRIHTDVEADKLSGELGAGAFTVGKDIFFAEDAYNPSSVAGEKTLRHELAHIVQRSTLAASSPSKLTSPDESVETEAREAETAVKPVILTNLSPVMIARNGPGAEGGVASAAAETAAKPPEATSEDATRKAVLLGGWNGIVVGKINAAYEVVKDGKVDSDTAKQATADIDASVEALKSMWPSYETSKPDVFYALQLLRQELITAKVALMPYAGAPSRVTTIATKLLEMKGQAAGYSSQL